LPQLGGDTTNGLGPWLHTGEDGHGAVQAVHGGGGAVRVPGPADAGTSDISATHPWTLAGPDLVSEAHRGPARRANHGLKKRVATSTGRGPSVLTHHSPHGSATSRTTGRHRGRPPAGAVRVSTATASATVRPPATLPVTVPSWLAPPSSPKTLSVSRLTCARFRTEASYPLVA